LFNAIFTISESLESANPTELVTHKSLTAVPPADPPYWYTEVPSRPTVNECEWTGFGLVSEFERVPTEDQVSEPMTEPVVGSIMPG
jgi:hypothetical protein